MDKPTIAAKEPKQLDLQPGVYCRCACGGSKSTASGG